jgi:hypothetical protein
MTTTTATAPGATSAPSSQPSGFQESNAQRIAEFLEAHEKVDPALSDEILEAATTAFGRPQGEVNGARQILTSRSFK